MYIHEQSFKSKGMVLHSRVESINYRSIRNAKSSNDVVFRVARNALQLFANYANQSHKFLFFFFLVAATPSLFISMWVFF